MSWEVHSIFGIRSRPHHLESSLCGLLRNPKFWLKTIHVGYCTVYFSFFYIWSLAHRMAFPRKFIRIPEADKYLICSSVNVFDVFFCLLYSMKSGSNCRYADVCPGQAENAMLILYSLPITATLSTSPLFLSIGVPIPRSNL